MMIRKLALQRLRGVINGTEIQIRAVEQAAFEEGENYCRVIRGILNGLHLDEAIRQCKVEIVHEEVLSDDEDQYVVKGSITCPKCKGRRVRYIEKQTRSADESQTLFNKCVDCKFRWKF